MKNILPSQKITFLTALGASFEYYDFIIYGLMAQELSQLFFDSKNGQSQLIQSFLFFAVGYFVRPLGGLLFGYLGDYKGRKVALLLAMSLMSFSTFSIGLLPTYETWGGLSTLLLALLRVLQGLSMGAELPTAMTLMGEQSPIHRRGWYCSWIISSTTLGAIFASSILFFVKLFFSNYIWMWRIPFLLGGVLAFICLLLRKNFTETEISLKVPKIEKMIFFKQLKQNWKRVIFGIIFSSFCSALIISNIYFSTYLVNFFHYSQSQVYMSMTIGLIWSAFITPLLGKFSDYYFRKKIFQVSIFMFLLTTPFFYYFIHSGRLSFLILFFVIYQTLLGGVVSTLFPILLESFPSSIRSTCLAICFNTSYSLMSLLPLLYSYILKKEISLFSPFLVLILISICSYFASRVFDSRIKFYST